MPTRYTERLRVPLRWWVQATMLVATLWLAFIVAMPAWLAWLASGAVLALTFGLLWWAGSAVVTVADGALRAGHARMETRFLGEVATLDRDAAHRALGVDADARAYLLTRPYLKRAVRVAVADPRDPTPYWLIGTRHPGRLSAAIRAEQGARPDAAAPVEPTSEKDRPPTPDASSD